MDTNRHEFLNFANRELQGRWPAGAGQISSLVGRDVSSRRRKRKRKVYMNDLFSGVPDGISMIAFAGRSCYKMGQ